MKSMEGVGSSNDIQLLNGAASMPSTNLLVGGKREMAKRGVRELRNFRTADMQSYHVANCP